MDSKPIVFRVSSFWGAPFWVPCLFTTAPKVVLRDATSGAVLQCMPKSVSFGADLAWELRSRCSFRFRIKPCFIVDEAMNWGGSYRGFLLFGVTSMPKQKRGSKLL